MTDRAKPPRTGHGRIIRELREFVAALDRRVPQVERQGEAAIAREAAALRVRALHRIEELARSEETPRLRPHLLEDE